MALNRNNIESQYYNLSNLLSDEKIENDKNGGIRIASKLKSFNLGDYANNIDGTVIDAYDIDWSGYVVNSKNIKSTGEIIYAINKKINFPTNNPNDTSVLVSAPANSSDDIRPYWYSISDIVNLSIIDNNDGTYTLTDLANHRSYGTITTAMDLTSIRNDFTIYTDKVIDGITTLVEASEIKIDNKTYYLHLGDKNTTAIAVFNLSTPSGDLLPSTSGKSQGDVLALTSLNGRELFATWKNVFPSASVADSGKYLSLTISGGTTQYFWDSPLPSTSGKSQGQVLSLNSSLEPDWVDAPTGGDTLPTNGTEGQILKKTSSGTEWANESSYTLSKTNNTYSLKKGDTTCGESFTIPTVNLKVTKNSETTAYTGTIGADGQTYHLKNGSTNIADLKFDEFKVFKGDIEQSGKTIVSDGQTYTLKQGNNIVANFTLQSPGDNTPLDYSLNVTETDVTGGKKYKLTQQTSNLNTEFTIPDINGKLDAPASGTTGQYLQKTSSGTAWATIPASKTYKITKDTSVDKYKLTDSNGTTITDSAEIDLTSYLKLSYSSTNNNKILGVVSGNLSWVNKPSNTNYQLTITNNGNSYKFVQSNGGTGTTGDGTTITIPDINGKLDAPTASGTTGQYLQKTSSGTAWASALALPTSGSNGLVLGYKNGTSVQWLNKDVTVTISDNDKYTLKQGTDVINGFSNVCIPKVWTGTQSAYDGITNKSTDTLYFITE